MKVNAEARNPAPVELLDPAALGHKRKLSVVTQPQDERDYEVSHGRGERNPAGRQCAPARRCPRGQTADKENRDEPDQNHVHNTIATKTTVPIVIPAAYQRSFPFSLERRPRHASSFRRARPL